MAAPGMDPHLLNLLAHHDDLTDARSGEDVDSETKLVARYQPKGFGENDNLLKNLVGIVKPAEPCTLILADGSTFESASKSDGYHLSVTFNNLVNKTQISRLSNVLTLILVGCSRRPPRLHVEPQIRHGSRISFHACRRILFQANQWHHRNWRHL